MVQSISAALVTLSDDNCLHNLLSDLDTPTRKCRTSMGVDLVHPVTVLRQLFCTFSTLFDWLIMSCIMRSA